MPMHYALIAILLVLWALFYLFVLCDFGQKVANQFELFENEICKCKWYLFPLEMQRVFAFAMLNAQHLVVVEGFGNIKLTHDTSKKVANHQFLLSFILISMFHLHCLFFVLH